MEGGLNERLDGLPPSEPLLSGIHAYDKTTQRSLFVSGTSKQIVQNDTYVKTRPKRMAVVVFRDTMQ